MTEPSHDEVLSFWLGPLDEHGCAGAEAKQQWWRKSDAFDQEIRDRFAACHARICAGEFEGWLETPRGRLAYVIVLDQLSRNMFRDSADMYMGDARALAAAVEGIDAGVPDQLGYHECYFLYMPLMHAEDLAMQDRCVALFRGLGERYPHLAESVENALVFAVGHRDIVARFGRFPHRNALVGRESTAEEKAFLEQPGSSF